MPKTSVTAQAPALLKQPTFSWCDTQTHTVHVHSTSYATMSLKWRWIFTNIIRTNFSSLSTRVYLAWTLVEYNDLVKKNEECPMALKYCIDDKYFYSIIMLWGGQVYKSPSLLTWNLNGSKLKSHPLPAIWLKCCLDRSNLIGTGCLYDAILIRLVFNPIT